MEITIEQMTGGYVLRWTRPSLTAARGAQVFTDLGDLLVRVRELLSKGA